MENIIDAGTYFDVITNDMFAFTVDDDNCNVYEVNVEHSTEDDNNNENINDDIDNIDDNIDFVYDMEDVNAILTFWFPNSLYQEYWFSTAYDAHIKANFGIYLDLFGNTTVEDITKLIECTDEVNRKDMILSIIIVLDQFSRNVHRNNRPAIDENDAKCIALVNKYITKYTYDVNQQIFMFLPYRHQRTYEYVNYVMSQIPVLENRIDDYPINTKNERKIKNDHIGLVRRFKDNTFDDYAKVTDTIVYKSHYNINHSNYDYNLVFTGHVDAETMKYQVRGCDSILPDGDIALYLDENCREYKCVTTNNYGHSYMNPYLHTNKIYKNVLAYVIRHEIRNVGLSLSGGVDSMVLLYILHHMRLRKEIDEVVAIHIDYCNRDMSKYEANMAEFFCKYLNIPFYKREITHVQRNDNTVSRTVYESHTKKCRFNAYKYTVERHDLDVVMLGHHAGDRGENILLNTMGGDILGLHTMQEFRKIDDVNIGRPLIGTVKSDIYDIAHYNEIPYSIDTTKESCLRGVIRKIVMPELRKIKPNVDKELNDMGVQSDMWAECIDAMIINPIIDTVQICKYGFVIPFEERYTTIPTIAWSRIMVRVYHDMLSIPMVSKKTMARFGEHLKTYSNDDSTFDRRFDIGSHTMMFHRNYDENGICNVLMIFMDKALCEKIVDEQITTQEYETTVHNGWTIKCERKYCEEYTPKNFDVYDVLNGKMEMYYECTAIPEDKYEENVSNNENYCISYNLNRKRSLRSYNKMYIKFFGGSHIRKLIPKLHIVDPDPIDDIPCVYHIVWTFNA
jgi:tRNA(Ile)-lysidine synthetase-like protein